MSSDGTASHQHFIVTVSLSGITFNDFYNVITPAVFNSPVHSDTLHILCAVRWSNVWRYV